MCLYLFTESSFCSYQTSGTKNLALIFTQSHGLEKYHNNSNIHIALYL